MQMIREITDVSFWGLSIPLIKFMGAAGSKPHGCVLPLSLNFL